MPQRHNMPYGRQKPLAQFFVVFLQDTKHNNIIDNFGICDTIKTAGDEIKLFNVHGYCIFSLSSIFMTSRENYPINMFDAKEGIFQIMDYGEMVATYDDEAEATGWYGPEVAFGLTYAYVQPGQSILDIGIGTGLGSVLFQKAGLEVYGMDISPQMIDACRSKGFTSLQLHDLTKSPYPYDSDSMDYAICSGVLNFFSDLTPIFQEVGRILRNGGLYVFVVGDRNEDEAHEITVEDEHTKSNETEKMYMHSSEQIDIWVKRLGFELMRSLPFTIFMDRERTKSMPAKTYLARKVASIEPVASADTRSSHG